MLDKLATPPPEVELIQTLLEAHDEEEKKKILAENSDKITSQFLETINAIIAEGESRQQSPELIEALRAIYGLALRQSMEKNLKS